MSALTTERSKRQHQTKSPAKSLIKNEGELSTQMTPRKYQYKPQNLKLFTLSKLKLGGNDTKRGFIKIGKNRKQKQKNRSCRCENKSQQYQQKQKQLVDALFEDSQAQANKKGSNKIVINLNQRKSQPPKKIHLSKSSTMKISEIVQHTNKRAYHFQKQIEHFLAIIDQSRQNIQGESLRQLGQDIIKKANTSRTQQMQFCFSRLIKLEKPAHEEQAVRLSLNGIYQETNWTDRVLKKIFKKMTAGNRQFELQPSTLKLNYKELNLDQLEFVSILFERIDPLYLNDINYPTFKLTALQKCSEELEVLIAADCREQAQIFGA